MPRLLAKPSIARRRRFSVVILGLLALPGCAAWDPRGTGFGDELAQWGQNLRPKGDAASPYGFSTKARQIERSLGVGSQ